MLTSTKTNNKTNSLKKPSKIWAAIILAGIVAVIVVVSGAGKFAYGTIRCGQLPVESTKWAGAYSYKMPGDAGYGIHMLSDYRFCTESEIKATNGYHRLN